MKPVHMTLMRDLIVYMPLRGEMTRGPPGLLSASCFTYLHPLPFLFLYPPYYLSFFFFFFLHWPRKRAGHLYPVSLVIFFRSVS